MDINKKRELQAQYKERDIVGGVYIIRNRLNNKVLCDASIDLQGSKNRFEFSRRTGSCVFMKLQKDWIAQKGEQFVFETLEELKKSASQTQSEFEADIALLKEIWLEKLSAESFY